MDTAVDPRLGRCAYLIIVDPETMLFETLENSNSVATGGAGISTAQTLINRGVQVVLSGNCGPNAYRTLSAVGVQVITGLTGKVREAVEAYKSGKLQPGKQPNVATHSGSTTIQ